MLVWFDKKNEIHGFQLCYDKDVTPHALTWFNDGGFSHNKIDETVDSMGRRRGTPMLVADGVFEADRIGEIFKTKSAEIEEAIFQFVFQKILEYRNGDSP